MKYVYVKDADGFVVKKSADEIAADETIISAAEYSKLSGEDYYQEHFTHGGKCVGAGRKKQFDQPLDQKTTTHTPSSKTKLKGGVQSEHSC